MASGWGTGFENCDIGGAQVYLGRNYLGLLRGECSVKWETETVDVYQGVPRALQGTIIRQRTGSITLECLEMTPDNFAMASGDGRIEEINSPSTETVTGEMHRADANKTYLDNTNISAATIVVKSEDGTTTYALTTDYTVGTDNDRTYLQVVTGGGIAVGDNVMVNYSFSQDHWTNHLIFGTSSSLNVLENLVFVKRNDRNNRTLVLQIWKAQTKGNLNFVFSEEANDVLGINLEFGIMYDSNHPQCPLGLPSWIDGEVDWDNLPIYPPTNNNNNG